MMVVLMILMMVMMVVMVMVMAMIAMAMAMVMVMVKKMMALMAVRPSNDGCGRRLTKKVVHWGSVHHLHASCTPAENIWSFFLPCLMYTVQPPALEQNLN